MCETSERTFLTSIMILINDAERVSSASPELVILPFF